MPEGTRQRKGSGNPQSRRLKRDDDEKEDKKGISWTHIFFLVLMFGAPTIPFFLEFGGTVTGFVHRTTGVTIPSLPIPDFNAYLPDWLQLKPPPPPSLQERLEKFYYKHNPDKMGDIEGILEKYEGREKELIRILERKYRAKMK